MISTKGKILIISGLIVLLGGFGASQALAQQSNQTPNFVSELAQKLGIDQSKVQDAVNQIHSERRAQAEQKFNEVLDQAVKDGKITAAQKQLILQKRQELEANRQNFKNMSPQERKTAMQSERQQLQDWAKQNNIDLKFLLGPVGHFLRFKGRWGK